MTDILFVTDTIISKKRYSQRRYDTDNIDIDDISRYFRSIDPSLIRTEASCSIP
jgi:Zn-dependent M32 family carboxypeptidase